MKRVKVHHFYNSTYRHNFYFLLSSEAEYVDVINRHWNSEVEREKGRSGGTLEHIDDSCQTWLFVVKLDHAIIAHEVFHACISALGKRNISPIDASGEEAVAYLIEWLTRKISKISAK